MLKTMMVGRRSLSSRAESRGRLEKEDEDFGRSKDSKKEDGFK